MDAYDHAMIAVAAARGTVTVRTQGPDGPAYTPATLLAWRIPSKARGGRHAGVQLADGRRRTIRQANVLMEAP